MLLLLAGGALRVFSHSNSLVYSFIFPLQSTLLKFRIQRATKTFESHSMAHQFYLFAVYLCAFFYSINSNGSVLLWSRTHSPEFWLMDDLFCLLFFPLFAWSMHTLRLTIVCVPVHSTQNRTKMRDKHMQKHKPLTATSCNRFGVDWPLPISTT